MTVNTQTEHPSQISPCSSEEQKEMGNQYFKQESYRHALKCYHLATELDSSNPIYWTNTAACHIKLQEYEEGLVAANEALNKDPCSVKALFQKATCLAFLREYKKSIETWNRLLEIEPTHSLGKVKRAETERLLVKLKFEEAIHVPDTMLTQSLVDSYELPNMVSGGYKGPVLPDALPSSISTMFIKDMVRYFQSTSNSGHGIFPERYALQIMLHAFKVFSKQESLVEISFPSEAKMFICGDVHGQFEDFISIFERFGWPSDDCYYLFNGDFVDRGSKSLEVVLTMLALKARYPNSFFMSRGNHESLHCNKIYGFEKEVINRYDEELFKLFQQVFNSIPLCHVIQNAIFVTHGGLPPNPRVSLDEIKKIDRWHDPSSEEDSLMHHLLWSDPRDEPGIGPSMRGTSVSFGPDITEAFLAFNRLQTIVRSHEYQEAGYKVSHNGKCITVFSAPCYMGGTNLGAVVQVEHGGDIQFHTFPSTKSNVKANLPISI
jgi:serine/threonine-protein phosphatase 5